MAREIAAAVDFCATVPLGKNGQFTIPKVHRQSLDLDADPPIAVL